MLLRLSTLGKWAKATANALKIEEEEGFDALVDLFDDSLEKNQTERCSDSSKKSVVDEEDSVDWPVGTMACTLTPESKKVSNQIIASVENDLDRRAAIERACPSWKENIELAQSLTDSTELKNALQNVKQAKTDIENMKERILEAFTERYSTLELFEHSLQCSMDKLPET